MIKQMKTFLLFSLITNVLIIDGSDPEIDLCNELTIDAAVIADDNVGYAFKGDFHWRISTTSGIANDFVAKYISERWEGLTGPIDAAFTIDESNHRLSTVFIKGRQWFLYKKTKLRAKGTIDKWPYVFQSPLMSAFEYFKANISRKDISVYLMYGSDNFTNYVFQDIQNPTYKHSGKAYRKGRFLSFLKDPKDDQPGTLLSTHIKPLAVISNEEEIIIYGDKESCHAKRAELPLCNKTDSSFLTKYYGCPRKPFPTTTTPTPSNTTSTGPTTSTTETGQTTPLPPGTLVTDSTISEILDSTTNKPTIATTKQSSETITQDLELTSKRPADNPTIDIDEGEEMPSTRGPAEEEVSNAWIYIVVIAIICLIVFGIIFFVMKISGNKTKRQNEIIDIKIDDKKEEEAKDLEKSSSLKGLQSTGTDESLGSDDKRPIRSPSDEEVFSKIDVKTDSNIEADEILESVKSNEDFN